MLHDATVEITCDGEDCDCYTTIGLEYRYTGYNGSGGHYVCNDSHVERKLTDEGWSVVDEEHFCEGCNP